MGKSGVFSFWGVLGLGLAVGVPAWASQNALPAIPNPNALSPCQISPNQSASFIGRAAVLPIHIHVDAAFGSPMLQAVQDAANEWNDIGKQYFHEPFFVVDGVDQPGPGHPKLDISSIKQAQDFCSQYADRTGLTLLREDSDSHWAVLGKGDPESQFSPALTYPCSFGSKAGAPVREMMVLNTSDATKFSVSNRTVWRAILLHELGHAAGLNHSCQPGSGNAAYDGCDKVKPGSPYDQSVMFPWVGFNNPLNLKFKLSDNDKKRFCYLYEKSLKGMSASAEQWGTFGSSVKRLPEELQPESSAISPQADRAL